MNLFEKANIIRFHRHRIARFPDGSTKALGWKAGSSQSQRFEILSRLADFTGYSILDVGCGYGDLKKHLDHKFCDFTYLGIDHMPEFITRAKSIYLNCEYTHFVLADFTTAILPKMDFVIACGTFGYRCEMSDFYKKMIRKLYKTARVAFAFNMLNADKFEATPLLVGHNADRVLDFCRSLSPEVRLIR